MRKGKYFAYTRFIMGIKLNPERFKEVYEEVKSHRKPGDWYEEESSLFNLHENVYGLDGYWIGNIEHPEGLVIGYDLESSYDLHEEIEIYNGPKEPKHPPGMADNLILESLKNAMEDFEDRCMRLFNYREEIAGFCKQPESDIRLHVVSEIIWMNEDDIKLYAEHSDQGIKYQWVIDNDAWDYRAD